MDRDFECSASEGGPVLQGADKGQTRAARPHVQVGRKTTR